MSLGHAFATSQPNRVETMPVGHGGARAVASSVGAMSVSHDIGRERTCDAPFVAQTCPRGMARPDTRQVRAGSSGIVGCMTPSTARSDAFRALHQPGTFVMPNPWDVGSARSLASLGFPALATTSAGFAWTLGKADGQVTLDEKLAHLRAIVAAVDVPINADFEGGFAVEPDEVAANVATGCRDGRRRAVHRGLHPRRRRAPVRPGPRGRPDPRRPRRHRPQRDRRHPDRSLGGVHRRTPGPGRDDPPAPGLRGGWRRLPVRARDLHPRPDRGRRQGRRPQAGERPHLGRLPAPRGAPGSGRAAPEHRRRPRGDRLGRRPWARPRRSRNKAPSRA